MTESPSLELPCPCGARLSYTACCGRSAASEGGARDEAPHIRQLYADAQQAARQSRFIHALTAAREILRQVPVHYGAIRLALTVPDPLRVLDAEQLEQVLSTGLAAYPDDVDLRCNAADAYAATGRPDEGEKLLREILRDHPNHVRAHIGLGNIANLRHQLDLAEYHLRQAWYQQQFAPGVLNQLGVVLSALGRKPEAEHYFRIALAQAPGDVATLINWCRMEESRGDLARAWRLLELARPNARSGAQIGMTEAVLHRREGNSKQALICLDAIDTASLDHSNKVAFGLERSTVLDQMGLYDQAFECAAVANEVKVNELGSRYDAGKFAAEAEHLRAAFTPARFKKLTKGEAQSADEEQPIFICGFTRSGTSMVEQILSAHSRICGGDELPFVYDLAANASKVLESEQPFPECLFAPPASGGSPAQVLRQRYLTRLRTTSILEPGVRKFTDKMPMNEMHLGLIRALFPEARIIHVVRHPLDCVLSTFFTDATHGGNCGYSLASAAAHYRLLLEMTEYYRKSLGIKLLRVRYEDIVRDIRKQTARMLKHLDEEPEEACLEFHLNPRSSRTASYAQVTEKLYDSSVYRYRNYEKHLAPVIEELKPAIKLLGYKV